MAYPFVTRATAARASSGETVPTSRDTRAEAVSALSLAAIFLNLGLE